MDPESSKGKVGKHQDLEQIDRQRPKRTKERGSTGADGDRGTSKTLQDAIDRFLDNKRSLRSSPSPTTKGSCRSR